jgi:hypothetical protein
MVIETIQWLVETEGIVEIVVNVQFPIADSSQVIDAVRETVKLNPDVKLAIFSHISSMVRENI